MPLVVVDTSVSLPATLSPRGVRRKFWLLVALGALRYRVDHGRLELDELRREAGESGGELRGLSEFDAQLELAAVRLATLVEQLPSGTPEDWVAAGSAPIFDEYERKLRERGYRLDPQLQEEHIPLLRRQLQAVCVAGPPFFDPSTVPAFTSDPDDDPIVYTALLAEADLLVSDDRHIVPDRQRQHYEHGDHRVLAVTFDELLREHVEVPFDWDEIDGELLARAYGPVSPS